MSHILEALIVSNNPELSRIVSAMLGSCGLETKRCSTLKEARTMLASNSIQMVFCENFLLDGSFRELLRAIADSRRGIPVVVLSSLGGWQSHREAIESGAFGCIAPPFRSREIEQIVNQALSGCPLSRSKCPPKKTVGWAITNR